MSQSWHGSHLTAARTEPPAFEPHKLLIPDRYYRSKPRQSALQRVVPSKTGHESSGFNICTVPKLKEEKRMSAGDQQPGGPISTNQPRSWNNPFSVPESPTRIYTSYPRLQRPTTSKMFTPKYSTFHLFAVRGWLSFIPFADALQEICVYQMSKDPINLNWGRTFHMLLKNRIPRTIGDM